MTNKTCWQSADFVRLYKQPISSLKRRAMRSLTKPYLVFLRNKKRPFAFAGLYDQWKNPDTKETIFSFTIITTPANPLLQSIGVKRMPVILSRSEEMEWLRASNALSEVLPLLNAYPCEKMNAYPVSEMINMVGVNDPSMLNPVGDKLLSEVKLIPAPKEIPKAPPWPNLGTENSAIQRTQGIKTVWLRMRLSSFCDLLTKISNSGNCCGPIIVIILHV